MLVLVLGVAAAGCSVGSGTGALAGTLFVDRCTTDSSLNADGSASGDGGGGSVGAAYDMHPSFFVADFTRDLPGLDPMNRLAVRMQSSGNRIEESDVMYLNVADVGALAQQLGQPVAVGPTTNARATLSLRRTCPTISVQLELDGTLVFTKLGSAQAGGSVPNDFSINFGDELTAAFSFDVVDRRAITFGTAPTAGGHLDGNFDFVVRQGRSAQAYP
jgi:hypothetical protein